METDHLIIRRFICDDFQDFQKLICDKMRSKYSVYDEQFPTDNENIKKILCFFKESEKFWAIELKETEKVIGFVSLNYIDEHTRNCAYSQKISDGNVSNISIKTI